MSDIRTEPQAPETFCYSSSESVRMCRLSVLRLYRIDIRDVFNNASAQSAIECFLSESKRSPRCLQALAIQVDRCFVRKSKMATKTIMGFREGRCTQYFQIRFSE